MYVEVHKKDMPNGQLQTPPEEATVFPDDDDDDDGNDDDDERIFLLFQQCSAFFGFDTLAHLSWIPAAANKDANSEMTH